MSAYYPIAASPKKQRCSGDEDNDGSSPILVAYETDDEPYTDHSEPGPYGLTDDDLPEDGEILSHYRPDDSDTEVVPEPAPEVPAEVVDEVPGAEVLEPAAVVQARMPSLAEYWSAMKPVSQLELRLENLETTLQSAYHAMQEFQRQTLAELEGAISLLPDTTPYSASKVQKRRVGYAVRSLLNDSWLIYYSTCAQVREAWGSINDVLHDIREKHASAPKDSTFHTPALPDPGVLAECHSQADAVLQTSRCMIDMSFYASALQKINISCTQDEHGYILTASH